jgi:signal transduction histidine kinase
VASTRDYRNQSRAKHVPDAETGELIEVNEAAATVIGEPREEIIGRHQRSLHPCKDADLYETAFSQAIGQRTTIRTLSDGSQPKLVTTDDEQIPIEISATAVSLPDGPVVYGMFRELPSRGEREQLERERNRLNRFASVVSHDLRGPLEVVSARLDLAAEECDSQHLDAAEDAIDRMGALIEDLLELAKQGKPVGEVASVDLAGVVESCWHNVPTDEATLRLESPRTIQADRSRLQQLLENLIRNAVDHGGPDVTITIGTFDDGFYVADDGSGIPDTERDDIFKHSYSTEVDGSGFGLSIVKEIVDAHDWEISVTESDSGGARFEITSVEFDE